MKIVIDKVENEQVFLVVEHKGGKVYGVRLAQVIRDWTEPEYQAARAAGETQSADFALKKVRLHRAMKKELDVA